MWSPCPRAVRELQSCQSVGGCSPLLPTSDAHVNPPGSPNPYSCLEYGTLNAIVSACTQEAGVTTQTATQGQLYGCLLHEAKADVAGGQGYNAKA